MVHIYNGILLSHKKEQNWIICTDMDGPRDCHTEWSKSEREIGKNWPSKDIFVTVLHQYL